MASYAQTQDDNVEYEGNLAFDLSRDFSLTLWTKFLAVPSPGNYQTSFSFQDDPLTAYWWFGLGSTGEFEFFVSDGDTEAFVDTFAATTGVWYGYGFTYDAATQTHTVYRYDEGDLTIDGTVEYALPASNDSKVFRALSDGQPSSEPEVIVAYVRLWHKKLTEQQILRELGSSVAVTKSGLTFDVPMWRAEDEFDRSGNGFDFTAEGDVAPVQGPDLPVRQYKQWQLYRSELKPTFEEGA